MNSEQHSPEESVVAGAALALSAGIEIFVDLEAVDIGFGLFSKPGEAPTSNI